MHRTGKTIAGLLLLILPLDLLAHEGHGHGAGYELSHYWLSPDHIIPAALVLALTIAFFLFRRARKQASKEPVKRD